MIVSGDTPLAPVESQYVSRRMRYAGGAPKSSVASTMARAPA
jgi:hypothetical protein